MNKLMVRLWGIIEGESPESINYQIAKALISNVDKIGAASQGYLAKLCNVSKPSISRFCKTLGYDEFLDFRADIANYFPDRGSKFLIKESMKSQDWIEEFLAEVDKNMTVFFEKNFQEQIERIIEDMDQFSNVTLLGNMQSGRTAENIVSELHNFKAGIEVATSYQSHLEILTHMKENHLYIVFSVSGEFFRLLFSEDAAPVHSKNTKIWLVTTNPLISKMENIDSILNCRTGNNLAGSNLSMDLLGKLIALGYWNKIQG